ncbi:MAG: hypothetical protein II187_04130 [Treponema sp.]|nr:hypothetical protein [Treponema sp.]
MIALSTIKDTVDLAVLAFSLFAGDPKEEERKQRVNVLFRRLYAETRSNLAVLDLVDKEKLKSRADWFKAVRAVAPLLKNEAGQLVLLGTDSCFREIKVIQADIDGAWEFNKEDGEDSDAYEAPASFRKAVEFCVGKIELLKSYASIDENAIDLFTRLVPSRRFSNICAYSKIIAQSISAYLACCEG